MQLRLVYARLECEMKKQLCSVTALLMFFVIGTIAPAQTSISVAGVVNAASFAQESVAPGSMISIFGTGLATRTVQASSLPLPNILDGTSVTVGGSALPLFFVSAGQINAQLPFQVANGSVQLTVRNSAGSTATRSITISAAAPGVFTTTSNGKGNAIAVHADFKLVQKITGGNALAGETIILFCTGLGALDNFNSAGTIAPSVPLANTVQKPTVLMDGRPAQVVFSGLAPGFIGLYQINFVVPQGVGGDVITTLTVGGVSSNPVTINVRGAYSLSSNYSGIIEYRNGQKYQMEWNSFSSLSPTTFGGNYRLLSGNAVLDSGSFQIQNTSPVFVGTGHSNTFAQDFVAAADTLDAGNSFFGILYEAPSLDKVTDFDAWYAGFTVTRAPPAPPPAPPVSGISSSCASLEGTLIFSGATFLGRVTSNQFAADSIGNQFGTYGSPFSAFSIFNTFGAYGSQFSSTSAFNDFASNPPIITNGSAAAYLTTNQFRTPRIDTRALLPCVGR